MQLAEPSTIAAPAARERWRALASGVAVVVVATLLSWGLNHWLDHTELVMTYLLGVVFVAGRYGRLSAALASLLSVASFDFWFVPPYHTFAVHDVNYLFTFGVMLIVGLVISGLTEQVRSRAEEAHQAQLAAETEALRSSLLSSLSHDLRTPLASIMGASSTLRDDDGGLDDSARRALEQSIVEEAERMDRLVTNLLDITRLESGDRGVQLEWAPLDEIVGSALARCEARLGSRQVEIEIEEEAALVHADPVLLEQVFVNLLENAARHTPETTRVRIGAERAGGGLAIDVSDDGPGFAADEQARLFQKFFRGRGAGPTGTGLGLSICEGIVRAHRGRIEARSAEGGGAHFHITLPWEPPPPELLDEGMPAP